MDSSLRPPRAGTEDQAAVLCTPPPRLLFSVPGSPLLGFGSPERNVEPHSLDITVQFQRAETLLHARCCVEATSVVQPEPALSFRGGETVDQVTWITVGYINYVGQDSVRKMRGWAV